MREIFIEESGMTFGPFSKDDLFHLEESKVYGNFSTAMKIAEFIY